MKKIKKVDYNEAYVAHGNVDPLTDRINQIIDALKELTSDIEYLKMLNPPKSSFQHKNPYDLSSHPLKRK